MEATKAVRHRGNQIWIGNPFVYFSPQRAQRVMLGHKGAMAQRKSGLVMEPICLFFTAKGTKGKMRARRLITARENGFGLEREPTPPWQACPGPDSGGVGGLA